MTSHTRPLADKYSQAREADPSALGPQTQEEQSLLALIEEGLHASPSIDIAIDDLSSQLRERIRTKA